MGVPQIQGACRQAGNVGFGKVEGVAGVGMECGIKVDLDLQNVLLVLPSELPCNMPGWGRRRLHSGAPAAPMLILSWARMPAERAPMCPT